MRGAFDEDEMPLTPARRDTELTLGSGMLITLFLGLVLLCGVCFGLGYIVGHREPQTAQTAVTQPAATSAAAQPGGSPAKPAAITQPQQAPPAEAADADQTAEAQEPAAAAPAVDTQPQPAPAPAAAAPVQPQVRPAFVTAAGNPSAQPTASAPATSTLMVQIAAVSNTEDADVLTNALRKRGYAVTERRDPADNLIHVRIGPFTTAAEANNWKMRLLNDGYNAIVQP